MSGPTHIALPRIGAEWPEAGGIFAGIVPGEVAGMDRDYALILGPEAANRLTWPDAVEWARGLKVGDFADYLLPKRREQSILFGTVRSHFKPAFYWSGEQHESVADYAYYQFFDDGIQGYWREDSSGRARAVRRFPICLFTNSVIQLPKAAA